MLDTLLKMPTPVLTVEILCSEATIFSIAESQHPEPTLYGVTDGKKNRNLFRAKI
jgi:hypothetical protein